MAAPCPKARSLGAASGPARPTDNHGPRRRARQKEAAESAAADSPKAGRLGEGSRPPNPVKGKRPDRLRGQAFIVPPLPAGIGAKPRLFRMVQEMRWHSS